MGKDIGRIGEKREKINKKKMKKVGYEEDKERR